MKKLIIYTIILTSLCGCKVTTPTPLPNSATAVLVGIGYRCDKKELQKKGSSLDVETMYETLRYTYYDNYKVGLQKPNCTYFILQDHRATIQNVKDALYQAINDELAIIYFSCKSTQLVTDDPNETDGLDECLQLYDGILKDNEIWEIISLAKGRVFIIFDTSNSSTMFRTSLNNNDFLMNMDNINTSNSNLNITCWSACLDNEVLPEKSTGGKLTTYLYFKFSSREQTYQRVFDKIFKSLSNKQNINKTIIGEDFSNKSMFR
jgi:hypothetical protein